MNAAAKPTLEKMSNAADHVAAQASFAAEQYLSFCLGSELFAVDISAVREIVQMASITVVPLMPDCIRGVTNLRGAVVPVMDLQARFGRGSAVVGRKSCVVILDLPLPADQSDDPSDERQLLGVMVDAVSAVLRLPPHTIEQVPRFGLGIRPEMVVGIAQHRGRSLVLLHLENTFHVPQLYEPVDLRQLDETLGGKPYAGH
ncbi:MAG: purine-binding chemotaxis protein CheW [Rhizobacter sp.]